MLYFRLFFVCWFFFLLNCHVVYPQQSSENTTLFNQADALLEDEKFEESLSLYNKALEISLDNKDWKNVARAYNGIARNQIRKSDYKNAVITARKALKTSELRLTKDHKEKAKALDNIGEFHSYQSDFDTALHFYNQALTIKKAVYDSLAIAESYNKIGYAYLRKGQLEKATEFYKKVAAIDSTSCNPHLAYSYNNLSKILYTKGKYEIALKYMKKGLQQVISEYGEDHSQTTQYYNNTGTILYRLGYTNQALDYFQKALNTQIKFTGEDNEKVVYYYSNLGTLFETKGDLENSIIYSEKALSIGIKLFGTDHLQIAKIYHNLGLVYADKGALDQALSYIKKAWLIKKEKLGSEHDDTSFSLTSLGHIHGKLHQYDIAIEYLTKALQNFTQKFGDNHPRVALTLQYLAEVYYNTNDMHNALAACKKSKQIRTKILDKNHFHRLWNNIKLGDIYKYKKEYTIALQYYSEALHIAKKNENYLGKVYYDIATLYKDQGAYQTAIGYYQKALDANSKNHIFSFDTITLDNYFDPVILLQTLNDLGICYIDLYKKSDDLKKLEQSITFYKKADQIINETRKYLPSNQQDKITFSETAKEIYANAIKAQYMLYQTTKNQEHVAKAFYFSEKSKSNTLKELLADTDAKNYGNISPSLLELERTLKIDKAFYSSKIADLRSKTPVDTTQLNTFENKIFTINRQQDSVTTILETQYPKYYTAKYKDELVELATVKNTLSDQEHMLEFFTTNSITYLFSISQNKSTLHTIKTPNLAQDVKKLQKLIIEEQLTEYKTLAFQLYQQLIQPVLPEINAEELVIIPDGVLWHLNFELLVSQKEKQATKPKDIAYLFKKYAISYANAASLLYLPKVATPDLQMKNECLAFSFTQKNKDTANNLISFNELRDTKKDLPGSRTEIKAISNIIDGQYFFGDQATETNFKKNASQYSILHLALHGEVDHEHPENSKLLFNTSKDTLDDNMLYTHELLAMQLPSELTILSACNTGSGKIANGEGIMSLGNSFQYAGSKSLLLSRWEVSDKTTPKLMQYFYEYLKKGMTKSKALQQAKIKYLNTSESFYKQPFYWGSFYLVGDPKPIEFQTHNTTFWMYGAIALALLLLGYFIRYKRTKS